MQDYFKLQYKSDYVGRQRFQFACENFIAGKSDPYHLTVLWVWDNEIASLENNYEFVRMSGKTPIFKIKETQ
jgi:hypothetical protein